MAPPLSRPATLALPGNTYYPVTLTQSGRPAIRLTAAEAAKLAADIAGILEQRPAGYFDDSRRLIDGVHRYIERHADKSMDRRNARDEVAAYLHTRCDFGDLDIAEELDIAIRHATAFRRRHTAKHGATFPNLTPEWERIQIETPWLAAG